MREFGQYRRRSGSEHTRVLEHKLDIEDGDDLSLSLTNIHVTVHAEHLADLGRDLAILGGELGQVLPQPVLRPLGGILADPMPVVGIVEGHCDAGDSSGIRQESFGEDAAKQASTSANHTIHAKLYTLGKKDIDSDIDIDRSRAGVWYQIMVAEDLQHIGHQRKGVQVAL